MADTKFASKALSDSHSHDAQDRVVTLSISSVGVRTCLLSDSTSLDPGALEITVKIQVASGTQYSFWLP